MDKIPLVSVIIPTYDRPEFLKKTLLSILAQTYTYLEIFVISNGENPKNKDVVECINDSRIIYRDQENSGGPSSPRNHGIRLSKGEYLAFCDDDDLWMSDKIEKQVHVLEKNLDYGLCYGKMIRVDDDKEWSFFHEEGAATFETLLYTNTVPISSVMIKKLLVDEYGGFSEDPKVGTAEDYEFLLRYAFKNKLYFLDEYLIKYWSGGNRTTEMSSVSSKIWLYFGYILSCFCAIKKTHSISWVKFLKPAFYHLWGAIKMVVYQKISIFKGKK